MDSRDVLIVGIVLLAMGQAGCTTTRQGPPPSVVVTGNAEVKVVPDIIDLELGVEARSKGLGTAFANQENQAKRILEAARAAGVTDPDLQSGQLSVRPIYDTRAEGQGALKQYELQRSIGIRLHDGRTYEALLSRCLEVGANRVYRVSFASSKETEFREQARGMAVAAARAKAVAMARKLGQEIGKATAIEEEVQTPWSAQALANNASIVNSAAAENEGGSLAVGQIVIRASVKVTFELK